MNKTHNNNTAPKPKHWLLAKSRLWHTWGGLFAALFLIVVGSSGIVLNYKKPIFHALGLSGDKDKPVPKSNRAAGGGVTAEFALTQLPVTFKQALSIADRELGARPLDRVELKREDGRWIYRIKQEGGKELWLDAHTSAHFIKGEYEKVAKKEGQLVPHGFDWGKFVLNLHTGKIGGEAGKVMMTVAAAALIFLSLSGVYLYIKPLLIRRANAAEKRHPSATRPPAIPATAQP